MASSRGTCIVSALVVLLAVISGEFASAQNTPSCAAKLVPCGPYLTSSSPPDVCCNPLKEAVRDERDCLCALFNSPDILKSFNINVTQALDLPRHCGVPINLSLCSQAPPPTAGSPPGTPGGDNGASGMATIGMSGLAGLILLWASLMA